jgi:hypothetical protein
VKLVPSGRTPGATVEGLDLPHEHRLIQRCRVMATRFFRNGEP